MKTTILLFLWIIFCVHFALVLMFCCGARFVYLRFIMKRIKTLESFVSHKSLMLLYATAQQQLNFFSIVNCCGQLFLSSLSVVVSVILDCLFSNVLHDSPWQWVGLNFIPFLFGIVFNFWFIRSYVSKVSLSFKYVNKDISFLKNCRFVNQWKYNFWLHWIVNRSIQKRLLNDPFRTRHPLRATLWIFQLYNIFGIIIDQGAIKTLIDTGQNSTITAEQMLKQICCYFDSWDIEIKTKRLAKKGSSKVFLQQFV